MSLLLPKFNEETHSHNQDYNYDLYDQDRDYSRLRRPVLGFESGISHLRIRVIALGFFDVGFYYTQTLNGDRTQRRARRASEARRNRVHDGLWQRQRNSLIPSPRIGRQRVRIMKEVF